MHVNRNVIVGLRDIDLAANWGKPPSRHSARTSVRFPDSVFSSCLWGCLSRLTLYLLVNL